MTETVLVAGAGIAGLGAALALSSTNRNVILIERDPPPPDTSPDDAFDVWERKGVGHIRHSHAFLAVLYKLIREKYPELLKELVAAGCRELKFADGLAATVRATYTPEHGDEDLTILSSRRTTLEYVMRRYVAALPGVRFETEATVRDLIVKSGKDGILDVKGLLVEQGGVTRPMHADVVIDAGGRNSRLVPWLSEKGAGVEEPGAPSGILYYTRHYRLLEGCAEPEPGKIPAAGDLGYIKYGVFPADNGCFSVTFALPEEEMEMRKAIVCAETFNALCAALPGLAPWVDPARAKPVGPVLGMGNIRATWREFVVDGKPVATGFFAIGDAAIRTNPLYGRGCSFGFLQAHILAAALEAEPDPVLRSVTFHARVAEELGPFFKDMKKQDLRSIVAARHIRTPGYKPGLGARIAKSFLEDGVIIVLRSEADILRRAMKAFHMIEKPDVFLKRPQTVLRILRAWVRGKKRNAAFYPPKLGPERKALFEALSLPWEKDLEGG